MKNYKSILIYFACSCIFISCELLDGSDTIEQGIARVQVQGYVNDSFYGEAIFETLSGFHSPIFFLVIKTEQEPGERYRIIRFVGNGSRPEAGKYNLIKRQIPDEKKKNKFSGSFAISGIPEIFISSGGSIKINESSEKVLKGTFNFPAYVFVSLGKGQFEKAEVTIKGTFYAKKEDTGIILN